MLHNSLDVSGHVSVKVVVHLGVPMGWPLSIVPVHTTWIA